MPFYCFKISPHVDTQVTHIPRENRFVYVTKHYLSHTYEMALFAVGCNITNILKDTLSCIAQCLGLSCRSKSTQKFRSQVDCMSDSFSLWQQIKFPISIFKVGICYLAITLTYYHCAHFLFISQRSMIQKIWLQI